MACKLDPDLACQNGGPDLYPTDHNDYHQTTVNRPTLLSSPGPKFIKLFPC